MSISFARRLQILVVSCALLAANVIGPTPAVALTFGDVINISETLGSSVDPQIAVAENGDVYLVWRDSEGSQDIFFAAGIDPENSFSDPINVSNDLTGEFGARIATSDGRVFVVWFENDGEVYYSNSTVDNNGNVDFSGPVNLSSNDGVSRNPQIAASGQNVYVVWEVDLDGSGIWDIFYSNSTDSGKSFSDPVNLSSNDGDSRNPRIATSSSGGVFIAWQDDTPDPGNERHIFVRASLDGGASFGDVSMLNNPAGFSASPSMIVSGTGELYLVWEILDDPTGNIDVFFSAGSVDPIDSSISFADFVNVSDNEGFSTSPLFIVSDSGIVYVAWIDDITGNNDVLISNSTDGENLFSPPISLSSGASVSSGSFQLTVLPSNGEDVYVVWRDANAGESGSGDIFITEITDGGHNIADPINLSDNGGISQKPVLGAFEDSLYVAWQDNTSGNNEVLFMAVSAAVGEPSTISIQSPSDATPKWGRSIEISGTTNGLDSDSVTVEWGDGSSKSGIPVAGSSWGPVNHTYSASNIGPNEIIAKLVDSIGAVKATSDPRVVTVLKHETTLTLELPNVVLQGENITASGILTDIDDGTGVESAAITFEGTGSSGLGSVSTDADGMYSAEGSSPNSPNTLWTVQARFLGNSVYEASNSSLATFDTAPEAASQFAIPTDSPLVVDLTGFNASISFDTATTEGTLFVSSCDAPSSPRYLSAGLCIVISSTEDLPPGSYAHLTISYAPGTLPDGHTEEEIDIFHEGSDGIVDITESRDTEHQTVTGRITDFSKFIVAVALHEAAEEGSLRKQVFVGESELVFNDVPLPIVTFDDTEYSTGSIVTANVQDGTANTDQFLRNSISVNITSDSDPEGIVLTLTETGNDTGVFSGTFRLVEDSSSSLDRELLVDSGDEIMGAYLLPAKGPFRIMFDDVVESGMVEVQEFTVDYTPPTINMPDFDAIGDAYSVRLVDAQLGVGAEITVIMSYVNVDLRDDEIISIDLFRVVQFDPDSISSGNPEWLDITSDNPVNGSPAVDPEMKTVTGVATFVGNFTIGHDVRDPAPPGGGGGGIPRPGTGIVLLESAAVDRDQTTDRTSSGGGGSRSAGITQISSGIDVETSITTESGTVTVRFESVQDGSGQISVESNPLSSSEDKFDGMALMVQDNDEHGIVRLNGATYSTASNVFDIDASEVSSQGNVEITIPYDETTVISLSGSESDVRLLHYDDETGLWEDATSSSDQLANTVTGTLDSLSSVVAAIIVNQGITFGEDYFEENPLARTEVASPSFSISEQTGEVTITTTVNNMQRFSQGYLVVAQIVDENNVAQYIVWGTGSAAGGQNTTASLNWKPTQKGLYSVTIFVLTEFDNPLLLSKAVVAEVNI